VDGFTEHAGTRRFWRRAESWSVPPRLGLIPVASSGFKGGPGIHVGPDTLVDTWGSGAPYGLGGAGPCTVGALFGGG